MHIEYLVPVVYFSANVFWVASHAGVFRGGRDEKRAPLKTPAWEAIFWEDLIKDA